MTTRNRNPQGDPGTDPATDPGTDPSTDPSTDAADGTDGTDADPTALLRAALATGGGVPAPAGRDGNGGDFAARHAQGFSWCRAIVADRSCHAGIASLTDARIGDLIRTRAAHALTKGGRDAADVYGCIAGETAFALGCKAANEPHMRGDTLAAAAGAYKCRAADQTGRAMARFGVTGPDMHPNALADGTLAAAVRVAAYGWEQVYRAC